MKLDIGESCFIGHNHHQHHRHHHHHHHHENYDDENYNDVQEETAPFYNQIIRTHPVQSSSQNARLLRNDQCAMTNEETRRLTGLVAKTRALFESTFVSNNDLNRKETDVSAAHSSVGVSSARLYLPNSQSINLAINRNGSSSNSNNNRNFCKIKQSLSANNVNGLQKFDQDDESHVYEDVYNEKENKTINSTNKVFTGNHSSQPNNYTKINIGLTNFSNSNTANNNVDSSAFSRPPFVRVKRFQSPSLSQSHQIFDSSVMRKNEKFSNEDEISPKSIKKSQSNNRLVFLNNFNNNNSNNLPNEKSYSKTNG